MTRRRKLIGWTVGALLALVLGCVVLIATFDWNRLKPYLDARISAAIGRPFAIDGDLGVRWQWRGGWLPWPQFTARQVRIANPAWAGKTDFASLDALRFRLSPWALLSHRIEVPTLRLVHPRVSLLRDAQGRDNWSFAPAASTATGGWKLEVGTVAFDRGQLTLDDALNRARVKATLTPLLHAIPYDQIVAEQTATASAQTGTPGGAAAASTMGRGKHDPAVARSVSAPSSALPASTAASAAAYQFAWQASGSYQGASVRGSGKIGAMLALQSGSQPFPLQADVHIGSTHIALVGSLTDPLQPDALNLQLWLSGNSMAALYPILGVTLPDTPPYATTGRLLADLDRRGSRFRYRNFRGHVGGSDLAGDLDYRSATSTGQPPMLRGKLTSRVLRFADLAPLIGAAPAGTAKPADHVSTAPGKVLPATPFRTERWRAMDADVTFDAARIEHGNSLPIESLDTHLVMKGGALTLDPLRFVAAGGSLAGSLRLDGSRSPMAGALRLKARHLKLKQLFPEFAPMRTSLGEINGEASLDARGNSVAALLGSADGELKLLMNDGAISRNLLEAAGLNVGNVIIGKLFGDKTEQIHCAAADMTARTGLFDMRLFVLDTADAVVDVTGTVNLATERLDLQVMPHTKGLRIFSLRSPLYVRGSLGSPDVGVEKGPLLVRGAGAAVLAVVAAPAAALLALIAPSHDNDGVNTCQSVLAQLRSSGQLMPASKAVPAIKPQAKKPPGD